MTTKLFQLPCLAAALVGASLSPPMLLAAGATGNRPALQLAVDPSSIDRNAADRVSYAPVIKKTVPSVVKVYATHVRREDLSHLFEHPGLRQFFGIHEGMTEADLRVRQGLGSGVAITSDGYILTSSHVVDKADEIKIGVGEPEEKVPAVLVGLDPLADIAVLKIEVTALTPATFGDSDQLQVGDVVLAIGNPFAVGQSVSRGIVSAVGRGNLGIEEIEDFIQTDAAINQGNSGGALVDSMGRLVGINTAIMTGSGGSVGVGFAIPINLARTVAEQIVTKGRVDRGFLGAIPQALTPELAAEFHATRGTLVAEVTAASPAEKAGLKAGDVITRLNEVEVCDPRTYQLGISKLPPNTPVKIEYLRDGEKMSAAVRLARRTDPAPTPAAHEAAEVAAERVDEEGVLDGVAVIDLTQEVRDHLEIPMRIEGPIVIKVEPTSPAARQGLRKGDVILELDRRPVKDAEATAKLSAELKGPRVVVRLWRQGQSRFLVVDESTGYAAR